MVGQQLRVENRNQVCQDHFRFHRHTLIERLLAHVAVNDLLLLESLEIGISDVFSLQGLVRKVPFVTVDDSPVVRVSRLAVHRFKVQRYPSGTRVIFQEIVGSGILEQLGKKTLSPPRHTSCLHEVHR